MPESVKRQLSAGAQQLSAVSQSPRLDAELLLAKSLDWPRSRLYARPEEQLSPAAKQQYLDLLAARARGLPVAYLLGSQEFWSLRFELGQDCLVPRPETEELVALALNEPGENLQALDLGTGSGVIAIALKHERPNWDVCAVERSDSALHWAKRNAKRLNAAVEILGGSWFEPVAQRRFDIIVSNPPYIAASDPHLAHLQHEPSQALISGTDGLDAMREIIRTAPKHLKPGALLALEHGHDQAAAVRALLQAAGLQEIGSLRDQAGHQRISHARAGVT